jgi:hypothetical protein
MNEGFWVAAPWLGVCAMFVFLGYLDHRTKRRRMEMLHQERLVALEKGVPLPEVPEMAPPPRPVALKTEHPNAALATGIILFFAGAGGVGALALVPDRELHRYWSTPLPLAMVGFGLVLYHYLTKKRAD